MGGGGRRRRQPKEGRGKTTSREHKKDFLDSPEKKKG